MDARKDRIGAHLAEYPPSWAERSLGPVPDDPLDRLEWQHRAADVGAYRELYGYEHPADPIGAEPTGDKRTAWQAAFMAFGPVDGVDLRGRSDGSLLQMRDVRDRGDRLFEFGEILVDGGLQDRMGSVEVSVGQVVAHPCDLLPWDAGLSGEQVGGYCLDRFADFQRAHPNSVEDQTVGQRPALQVRADRLD